MRFIELLERVSEDNVEYRREIIHVIEQSYKDPDSINRFMHARAFRVRNSLLLNEVSLTSIPVYLFSIRQFFAAYVLTILRITLVCIKYYLLCCFYQLYTYRMNE